MKQKNKIIFCVVIGIIVVSVGVGMQWHRGSDIGMANVGLEERVLTVGDTVLQVEVAQTPKQRRIGLSYRETLAEGRGMFFVFDTDGRHAMWMKDMQFPIDIVWVDRTMRVVHIAPDVAPETYPQSFASPIPAQYVLEVPVGYTQGNIMIGDTVLIQKKYN